MLLTLHVIAKILYIHLLGIIFHHAINTMEITWHGKGVLPIVKSYSYDNEYFIHDHQTYFLIS